MEKKRYQDKEFADRARHAYEASGKNQTEIADSVGISQSMLSRYIRGSIEHRSQSIVKKIADVTGVSVLWLDYGAEKYAPKEFKKSDRLELKREEQGEKVAA
jgi:transcriptional regulator with XRE-family HTH domain